MNYERKRMTDMNKYKNVSLQKETYSILEKLSKVLLPDGKLSISKTIEVLANKEARKLNGKIKSFHFLYCSVLISIAGQLNNLPAIHRE